MKKLVIGASGFLGSHATRQLVQAGQGVRVMLRRSSSTRGIDDLDVERHFGGPKPVDISGDIAFHDRVPPSWRY